MLNDNIDLVFKLLILFFIGGFSEIAFKKRYWERLILSLGIWLTIFRTAFLRAIAAYDGVFNHALTDQVRQLQNFLMNGFGAYFTDFVLLVGSFAVFLMIVTEKKRKNK